MLETRTVSIKMQGTQAMKAYETEPGGTPSQVQMLTRYKAWANEITFESVSALPKEEIAKERQTTFKTIIHTLNHVYVVDDIFKAHLEGRKHDYTARNTEISPALGKLWEATGVMDQWYIELADRLTNDELSDIVEFEFVGGGRGAMSRMEILLHLVNHATYHRGFVSDMLYQVPVRPSANDLTVFLRDVWNRI